MISHAVQVNLGVCISEISFFLAKCHLYKYFLVRFHLEKESKERILQSLRKFRLLFLTKVTTDTWCNFLSQQ